MRTLIVAQAVCLAISAAAMGTVYLLRIDRGRHDRCLWEPLRMH